MRLSRFKNLLAIPVLAILAGCKLGGSDAKSVSQDSPVIASCGTVATEDFAYSCTVTSEDSGLELTRTDNDTCDWLTASGAGPFVISGTPDNSASGSTCVLAFKIGHSQEKSFTINVVNTPPALSILDVILGENSPSTVIRNGFLVQASDEGQGTTTYSLDIAGTTGSKCDDHKIGLSINATTGAITYQPAINYVGACNIRVAFDDGRGGSVEDQFLVTVNHTTSYPVLSINTGFTLGPGEKRLFTIYFLRATDPDTANANITFTITATPTHGTLYNNGAPIAVSGTFTEDDLLNRLIYYEHDGTSGPSDSFSLTIQDNQGHVRPAATFNITLKARLSYPTVRKIYRNNAAIATLVATTTGFTPTGYTVDNTLPTGLSLNALTGDISGTPTVVTAASDYTITATDGVKSATHVIKIEVMDGYVVNDNGDGIDAGVNDGNCATAGAVCTLRAAIMEVVGNGGANKAIFINSGIGTITPASVYPDLTQSMTIVGAGSALTTVDCANGAYRAFNSATAGKTIRMLYMTVKRCKPASQGGAVNLSSATGTYEFFGMAFDSNSGTNGGAVAVLGNLTIDRSSFSSNAATGVLGGGGLFFTGTSAPATVKNSTFTSNTAVGSADAGGGGAINFNGANLYTGTITLTGNLFASNATSDPGSYGGAILFEEGGATNVSENTFTGNYSEFGGAMADNSASTGTITLINNTIANNSAGGSYDYGGGVAFYYKPSVVMQNNIVAFNTAGGDPNCSIGSLTSLGSNLSDTGECAFGTGADAVSLTVNQIGLTALGAHGGPTQSYCLEATSFGIDRGVAAGSSTYDQRGYTRSVDADGDGTPLPDSGACEAQ